MFMYYYCCVCSVLCICFHRANWYYLITLAEVLRAFSSLVKQMPGYNSQRRGTERTIPILILLFYIKFVCKCVLCYCRSVLTQLQLTNVSTHQRTICV